eukprot:748084-Amphidinium_carterae.1
MSSYSMYSRVRLARPPDAQGTAVGVQKLMLRSRAHKGTCHKHSSTQPPRDEATLADGLSSCFIGKWFC